MLLTFAHLVLFRETLCDVVLIMRYLFQFWSQGIQCQLCHMMFRDQSAINAHYNTAHSQPSRASGTHECDICGKKFVYKGDLKRHLSTAHGLGDVKTFQCDVCSRVFNKKGNLYAHMRKVHKFQ